MNDKMNVTPDQIKMVVKRAIAKVAELEESDIENDTHFINDLGMDSMLLLESLTIIEKELSVSVSEEYLPRLISINECMKIIDLVVKQGLV